MPSNDSPEHVIYQSNSATVTTSRAIIAGTTYAMGNITFVRAEKRPGNPLGWLIIALGAVLLFSRQYIFGIICVGFGALFTLAAGKPKYRLIIGASGGEKAALESHDRQAIMPIVDALNEAIAKR